MRPPTAAPTRNTIARARRLHDEAAERRNRIADADAGQPLASARQFAVFACQGGAAATSAGPFSGPRTLATPSGLILVAPRLTAPRGWPSAKFLVAIGAGPDRFTGRARLCWPRANTKSLSPPPCCTGPTLEAGPNRNGWAVECMQGARIVGETHRPDQNAV
jgi:hypothetical protein